jgi:hypothetical protein
MPPALSDIGKKGGKEGWHFYLFDLQSVPMLFVPSPEAKEREREIEREKC